MTPAHARKRAQGARAASGTRAKVSGSGFTLLEMLAVMFLAGLVLTVAVDVFLDLSRQSRIAVERTRDVRRAVSAVDRIARDLSAAFLVVKPPETDPLEHPWLFLAETRDERLGSDRVKFSMRGHAVRASQAHESDLATVAYGLREGEGGAQELVQWTLPRLPEGLDRTFPFAEEDGARVLLEDVALFGLRFQDEAGEWLPSWDSSTLVESSQLPFAVEISLALAGEETAGATEAPEPLVRRVVLPLRPLDLEALLEGEDAGAEDEDDEEDEEGEGVTVAECRAKNPGAFATLFQQRPDLEPVVDSLAGQPFSEVAGALPVPVAVTGCE